MLKILKLRKKYLAHFDAAYFCCEQQMKMLRNMEFLTDTGEAKWQDLSRRFYIHMDAYNKILNEYKELMRVK